MKTIERFTIVVPTIGRPRYLAETLESIFRQNDENVEVIISDNASEPPIILPRDIRPGIRVRLTRRKERLPFVDHINLCLSEVGFGLVMFVSDDDLIHPATVSTAREIFDKSPEASVVLPGQKVIDKDYCGLIDMGSLQYSVMNSRELCRQWMAGEATAIQTVFPMIIRCEKALAVGGFAQYPSGAHSDNILFVRLCQNGLSAIIHNAYLYRIYEGSIGLSMPWEDLLDGTKSYLCDLEKLKKTDSQTETSRWIRDVNKYKGKVVMFLAYRWYKIYRKKIGFFGNIRATILLGVIKINVLIR